MYRVLGLIVFFFLGLLSCSSEGLSGTATDTNSGSITASIVKNQSPYKDSVRVYLCSETQGVGKSLKGHAATDTLESIVTSTGVCRFDSLEQGTYSIQVEKDSITVGEHRNIEVSSGQNVNITINITIIINQYFNITFIGDNADLGNLNLENGYIVGDSTGEYNAVFSDQDTIKISADIVSDTGTQEVTIYLIKGSDGAYSFLIPEETEDMIIKQGETIVESGESSDSASATIKGDVEEKPSQEVILDNALQAWYPFNGNAEDKSGNGNHGIVYGATLTQDRHGNQDNAFYFDGNDSIIIDDSDEIRLGTTSFTISCWIKMDSIDYTGVQVILYKGDGSTTRDQKHYIMQFVEYGNLRTGIDDNANKTEFTSGNSYSDSNWHFVAFVRDRYSNELLTYGDGKLDSKQHDSTEQSISNNDRISIGYFHTGDLCNFSGKIDDIRIYNKALSEDEIQMLYNDS